MGCDIPSHSHSRLTNERHLSLNNSNDDINWTLWLHVTRNKRYRYSILLACIRIDSTNGNFGTHEKLAFPIPIVTCTLPIPIPIYGIFVFPFHGNPMGMGIPFPCTSLDVSQSISENRCRVYSTINHERIICASAMSIYNNELFACKAMNRLLSIPWLLSKFGRVCKTSVQLIEIITVSYLRNLMNLFSHKSE